MHPVLTIPIINGVARPVHFDAQLNQEPVDGEVWYELDHPIPPLESSDSSDLTTLQEQNLSDKRPSAEEKEAASLLSEYMADAHSQIESHKEKWLQMHPESVESTTTAATLKTPLDGPETLGSVVTKAADEHEGEKKAADEHEGEKRAEKLNKWNKNHDHRDLEQDVLNPQSFSKAGEEDDKQEDGIESTGKQGGQTRSRVLAHHHHHHAVPQRDAPLVPSSHEQQQQQQQTGFAVQQGHRIVNEPSLEDIIVIDKNPDILEKAEPQQETDRSTPNHPLLSIPVQQRILLAETDSPQEEPTSNLKLENTNKDHPNDSAPAPLNAPESLRTRGLVPSVLGAHHCTPQFCVNVSVTEDGQFATFHIERDMAHTGWIALGIGYAMTMADLIVLWPTPSTNRGAVLSRRTSHAYIEPHLVGHDHPSNPLSDRPSEASLYPPNEYILHNGHPLSTDLHGHPLISAGSSSKKKLTPATLFPQDPTGSKKFIVQFTRPVKTVNRAFQLTPGTEQDFCWAYCPKPVSPDSVQDPAAHITQHQSVGSFAMDVAANQPGLKDVIQRLKIENEKEAAAEKERRKKELEESNRKLADEEKLRAGIGAVDSQGEGGFKVQLSEAKVAWVAAGWQSSLTLQACSCLVAVAFMFFFR
ncbi:hypothetical protein BGZ72_005524 [Mortierella alpina]|nr:hypothetical protein BGZ72_005524 [Mortierella alpina]